MPNCEVFAVIGSVLFLPPNEKVVEAALAPVAPIENAEAGVFSFSGTMLLFFFLEASSVVLLCMDGTGKLIDEEDLVPLKENFGTPSVFFSNGCVVGAVLFAPN